MWTSRKFISAWILTGITTGLVLSENISDMVWGSTLSIIWATYFAANVGSKYVGKSDA